MIIFNRTLEINSELLVNNNKYALCKESIFQFVSDLYHYYQAYKFTFFNCLLYKAFTIKARKSCLESETVKTTYQQFSRLNNYDCSCDNMAQEICKIAVKTEAALEGESLSKTFKTDGNKATVMWYV